MLYDMNVVTWLRKEHNILGVLVGTLHQIPSQNVFLALPLELQPEEARLLVEKGLAYIVNDLNRHQLDYEYRDTDTILDLKNKLQRERLEIARTVQSVKRNKAERSLGKVLQSKKVGVRNEGSPTPSEDEDGENASSNLLDGSQTSSKSPDASPRSESHMWSTTPSSSSNSLSTRKPLPTSVLPKADPSSYALFSHLHKQGYFMTPGLRFGCRFSVYPGDPLRFHSHFLATSAGWDEEIDLLHLVGGGRLGTGVKKAWMIGGIQPQSSTESIESNGSTAEDRRPTNEVRTFCIEWGGM